ncbi:putative conjugative transfer protein TraN [Orientia tsutsugamushi str. Gilliam]|uniref:Putative conjugative transfer protein TraN n=1 Tax=Orientia tsutsugamushi str. Gilliam TaxID=1359184 RepID=A0A0F3M9H7_ORITS|nr:putative conjugative transfer protein TraN [Orientia tsutsugamushi str. Gilliam]
MQIRGSMASMAKQANGICKKRNVENHSNWLHGRSDVYDESGAQIYCLVDDPEAIEKQMKRAIANRLGASIHHIGRNFLLEVMKKYVYFTMTTEIRLKN